MNKISWLTDSHLIMVGLLLGFAVAHSGLAALRSKAEAIIGPRLYRVIFALVSIPFATIFNYLLFQSSLRWAATVASSGSTRSTVYSLDFIGYFLHFSLSCNF